MFLKFFLNDLTFSFVSKTTPTVGPTKGQLGVTLSIISEIDYYLVASH